MNGSVQIEPKYGLITATLDRTAVRRLIQSLAYLIEEEAPHQVRVSLSPSVFAKEGEPQSEVRFDFGSGAGIAGAVHSAYFTGSEIEDTK